MDDLVTPPFSAPTILVVDDEDAVRFLFVEVLTDRGFNVVEASTGAEALDRLATVPPPALLIVDSGLPDMAGEDVAVAARRNVSDLKVLFVTGKDAGDLAHPLDARTGLLVKPFSLIHLAAVVADLIAV
jgi:two-component system, cell cycle sensor histidine kinase and response regulator CckA